MKATVPVGRRAFLRSALGGIAGVMLGAVVSSCSDAPPARRIDDPTQAPPPQPTRTPAQPTRAAVQPAQTPAQPTQTPAQPTQAPAQPTSTGGKVLLAYFSRAGENYNYGGRTYLEVGNTEVVAGMISRLIACDVHRIEPVNPYPEDYEATVAQNAREQEANARPAIANPLASIASYDIVLLGSPIWGGRAPMIMSTFVEGFDFTGKIVFPFTTHAGSGLGTTVSDYTASCPDATIGEGLAVRGEEVQEAGAAVESWLRRVSLLA
jgi:flavodoxin